MSKETKIYLVRDMPAELHRRLKCEAAKQGKLMQDLVIDALQAYLTKKK